MEQVLFPEMSVNGYHTMPRDIPQERRSHKCWGRSLKSIIQEVAASVFSVEDTLKLVTAEFCQNVN
jgi:hypothetical protein